MATKNKVVMTGIEARNKLVKGADFLADAVKSTLGPWGANAAIEKRNIISNDGATIAREITLKDEVEDRGRVLITEAGIKTDEEAGDGTTTAITLAQAVLHEALRYLPNGKAVIGKKTPAEVMRIIEREGKEVIEKLVGMAIKVETKEELIKSAVVSVEDEELGKLIGEAQFKLGPDGVLMAEETNERECSVEYVRGIRIDNGVSAPGVMNNLEKQSLELKDVSVILTNHTLVSLKPIEATLKALARSGTRGIVIIARAFGEQAIKDCMANLEAGFGIYPVNAPYTDQVEIMKDLVAVLGGRFIGTEESDIEDMQVSDVGFASNLIAKRYESIIAGAEDEKGTARVEARIAELKEKLAGNPSEFERKNLEARIAQLSNGFAVVKIGAASDTRRKYLKAKADDAVNSVRSALQEGVVPGAGKAFMTISDGLPEDSLLKRPLRAIYEQIASTAPEGFEVPEWVRDPVKVLRIALRNACSSASTIATTQVVIAEERPKELGALLRGAINGGDNE